MSEEQEALDAYVREYSTPAEKENCRQLFGDLFEGIEVRVNRLPASVDRNIVYYELNNAWGFRRIAGYGNRGWCARRDEALEEVRQAITRLRAVLNDGPPQVRGLADELETEYQRLTAIPSRLISGINRHPAGEPRLQIVIDAYDETGPKAGHASGNAGGATVALDAPWGPPVCLVAPSPEGEPDQRRCVCPGCE